MGADIDAKNNYGETVLHSAAISGYEGVVRLLLQRGADINAKNRYGKTALDFASTDAKDRHRCGIKTRFGTSAEGYEDIVELLNQDPLCK